MTIIIFSANVRASLMQVVLTVRLNCLIISCVAKGHLLLSKRTPFTRYTPKGILLHAERSSVGKPLCMDTLWSAALIRFHLNLSVIA